MAEIIKPPYFDSVVNAGEKRLLDFLQSNLPDNYFLIPNVEIASTNPRNKRTQFWEYDLVVVAPHGIYNIENKDWKGRIEGADDYWYVNDMKRPNPLKTNRKKTAILASKLKEANSDWRKAWIQNMVSLSYRNFFEPLIWQEAAKLSFTLTDKLVKYITDPKQIGKRDDAIVDIQNDIVQFLTGEQNKKSPDQKKEVQGYEIVEIIKQESDNYVEYLVKPKNVTSNIRKCVKEYALQVVGLSPEELRTREEIIKNQYNALKKIRSNPFILPVEFKVDEENHLFYEITDLMEEDSLRSAARNKTFTFDERINILKNIMSALKAAHKENIFHRDINPENIFLYNGYAYLGNFGKSYFTDHNDNGYTVMHTISESNASPYHPLELIAKDASRASDIYSLGVLIAWLFTDTEPIKSPFELDKLGGELPKDKLPSAKNSSLPKWLDEICLKTILTDSDKRIDSLEELEKFINDALKIELSTKEQTKSTTSSTSQATGTYEVKEGDKVGDYIIHKRLGRGGYSRVFKAKHDLQGKYYALKLFHESANISSVLDEYTALIELKHPNIVKFFWNGTTPQNQFYTTTEFLDGDNLSTYIKTDANLSIARVYRLATEMLSALKYLQTREKPILHRDIKPQNIILDNKGRFVLIDFNVASLKENDKSRVGTNPYLAPDLLDGHHINWDFSADTFALGITLYELVTKNYPWPQSRIPKISKNPTNPKELNSRISEDFSEFLLKAIGTSVSSRFTTAKEMLESLEEIGEDNLLAENKNSNEGVQDGKLYHIEIIIVQGSTRIKWLNKMFTYGEIRKAVRSSLSKFKDKIKRYKKSISLDRKLNMVVKVDNKILINKTFWTGGARNFNDGNIDRVYKSLKECFENNKKILREHKLDVEGIDIVDYINSLYSQSKSGNWGTRVRVNDRRSKYDELTYSPSKLDRKLIPDILDARFKLIIITGNAGDGKTAFIRKIEDNSSVKNLKRFEHKNGAGFDVSGTSYESNYDGSQDEDGKINNEVLESFFNPFEGLENFNDAQEGKIIAINEGRLVEFLKTSEKHKSLHDTIDQYFYKKGHFKLPQGLMIINLNLRSVTAMDEQKPSLFRQQVKALTKKSLWNKCKGCSVANKCFIKYNVESLNDSASGDEIITRMEWLLRTVSLKRELHITMRDLRSYIAFIISRDHNCEEVESTYIKLKTKPEKYWQLYYFNLTSSDYQDSGDNDRLVKLLRETDIGNVAIPNLDRDLFFGQHINSHYLEFSDRKSNLIDDFNKIRMPAHEQTDELLDKIKTIQKTYIRHQYFEGRSDKYKKRLPYQSLFSFCKALNIDKENSVSDVVLNYVTGNDEFSEDSLLELKISISQAISMNEGCKNKAIWKKHLVLSSSEINDPFSKSFRLFNLDDFELFVSRTDHLVKYLEYEPDSLVFRHKKELHIQLVISLDLFEMLYFIQKGYSPSLNDIRGKFVELTIFKNLLENLTYNKVVVTKDNIEFYEISKDANNHLSIETMQL